MSVIFVVEDDQYVSRVMERAFRFAGYEVVSAVDGDDAWKKLEELSAVPAAILVDILMPNMNGIEFIKLVRGNNRYDEASVIVLTNSFHSSREVESRAAGADDYIIKFDHTPKEIVSMIEAHLGKRKKS